MSTQRKQKRPSKQKRTKRGKTDLAICNQGVLYLLHILDAVLGSRHVEKPEEMLALEGGAELYKLYTDAVSLMMVGGRLHWTSLRLVKIGMIGGQPGIVKEWSLGLREEALNAVAIAVSEHWIGYLLQAPGLRKLRSVAFLAQQERSKTIDWTGFDSLIETVNVAAREAHKTQVR